MQGVFTYPGLADEDVLPCEAWILAQLEVGSDTDRAPRRGYVLREVIVPGSAWCPLTPLSRATRCRWVPLGTLVLIPTQLPSSPPHLPTYLRFLRVCMRVRAQSYIPQTTTYRSFSPFTMWVPRVELKLSGLEATTFTSRVYLARPNLSSCVTVSLSPILLHRRAQLGLVRKKGEVGTFPAHAEVCH